MQRSLAAFLALAAALVLPLAAHADPIDNFVLTGEGNTIAYSLPVPSSFPDFNLFNSFQESASTTINGVSGYSTIGEYYLPGLNLPVSFVLYVPPTISATGSLPLIGSQFISWAFEPASNSEPYLPYNVVPTFIRGTYILGSLVDPSLSYTLSITPETTTAATPEPSTALLLGTGIFALMALTTLKRRRTAFL